MNWLFWLLMFILLVVGLFYSLFKKSRGEEAEDDMPLHEEFLMGTSVCHEKPKPKPEEEKTLMERVYSGKGHQPRYMRYIADRERRRAIEAAALAEKAESQNHIDQ